MPLCEFECVLFVCLLECVYVYARARVYVYVSVRPSVCGGIVSQYFCFLLHCTDIQTETEFGAGDDVFIF